MNDDVDTIGKYYMRPSQTKWQSLKEQTISQLMMLVFTIFTAQLFVYDMFGVQISLDQNIGVGIYFTIQSIVIRYFIRRYHELHC